MKVYNNLSHLVSFVGLLYSQASFGPLAWFGTLSAMGDSEHHVSGVGGLLASILIFSLSQWGPSPVAGLAT